VTSYVGVFLLKEPPVIDGSQPDSGHRKIANFKAVYSCFQKQSPKAFYSQTKLTNGIHLIQTSLIKLQCAACGVNVAYLVNAGMAPTKVLSGQEVFLL
jgi:hypothetical protein